MAITNINPYGQGVGELPTTSAPVVNNCTTTTAGSALDARQGKELKDLIDGLGGQSSGQSTGQPVDTKAWLKACKMRLNNLFRTVWSPVANMPKTVAEWNSTSVYAAGSSNTGMPYSDTREINKFVGMDVSIYTFLTAVRNPYSLLYTEIIMRDGSSTHSQSAYGKTYTATDESTTYYGVHCTASVDYIIGVPLNYSSRHHNATTMGKWLKLSGDVNNRPSADTIKLYDVIWRNGHCALISDIKYNADGTVASVIVSESVKSLPKKTSFTAAQFNSTYNTATYRLYTPQVDSGLSTEYEDLSNIKYNDDICTIAGDKAAFRQGDTIGITYTIKTGSSYTKMIIQRNGSTVKTYTGLTANDSSSALADHLKNLTNESGITQGIYKAFLSNDDGTVVSEPTCFEVIDTNITYSYDSASTTRDVTIGFSSERGTPINVDFVSVYGHNAVRYYLTDDERKKGKAVIPFKTEWGKQKTNYDYGDLSTLRVTVLFKGMYGIVCSDMITTAILPNTNGTVS